MKFLCGCDPLMTDVHVDHYLEDNEVSEDAVRERVTSRKTLDEEGFHVCPTHLQRLQGWASTPERHSPESLERRKRSEQIAATMKFEPSVPDKRDNRDPLEMAAEREATGNGAKLLDVNELQPPWRR